MASSDNTGLSPMMQQYRRVKHQILAGAGVEFRVCRRMSFGYTDRMSLQERSRERKSRIVTHRARSFADAEQWDLEFWQRQSPAPRNRRPSSDG